VVIGIFPLKDLWPRTIAMMIRILEVPLVICRIRVVFLLKRRMYQSTVVLKSNSSTELMETGRLRLFSPHTLSWMMELKVSPTVFLIALLALVTNATVAQRAWLTPKLMMPTHVVTTVKSTVNGSKEFTLVFTVTWILLMLCALGRDSPQPMAQQNLVCLQTVVQPWPEKLASFKNDY